MKRAKVLACIGLSCLFSLSLLSRGGNLAILSHVTTGTTPQHVHLPCLAPCGNGRRSWFGSFPSLASHRFKHNPLGSAVQVLKYARMSMAQRRSVPMAGTPAAMALLACAVPAVVTPRRRYRRAAWQHLIPALPTTEYLQPGGRSMAHASTSVISTLTGSAGGRHLRHLHHCHSRPLRRLHYQRWMFVSAWSETRHALRASEI